MSGMVALRDFFRNALGVGINSAAYSIKRLVDDASITAGNTASDADPATPIAGMLAADETTLGYPGPVKYVVSDPVSLAVREHTSKSLGIVGAWRSVDVTRGWRPFGAGVMPGVGGDLAVTTNGTNLQISVAAGAYVAAMGGHGLVYSWPASRTLTATAAHATLPRIDTVALRFYPPGVTQEGRIDLVLLAGAPNASPVAPALTQDASTYWEEALADVRVDATVTSLAVDKVTDRRASSFLYPANRAPGDLFVVDAAGKLARLPKGTLNQYLKQGATIPAWDTLTAADLPDLGTMATQSASAVAITGGTIDNITLTNTDINGPLITGGAITGLTTDLAVADGGTGASTAAAARTNLGAAAATHTHVTADVTGLGTMATQNAAAVAITGGAITGITDLAITDGGTGASTAAAARANLGVSALGHTHPIATDVTGLGSGVAAFLATPSSANLAAAVTDEVGVGKLVFSMAPLISTPTLDTAALTNNLISGGSTPSISAQAAAGNAATGVDITGNDVAGIIQLTPGGSGITAGTIARVTFATSKGVTSFAVLLSPASTAARALGGVVGATSRSSGGFDLDTRTALSSGSVYQWFYWVVVY